MNFCINCNSQVKDDEEVFKVEDLSASAVETLTNHGCELIADTIICKECREFFTKECSKNGQTEKSVRDIEDIGPLEEVLNSQPENGTGDQKCIEAYNKDDTDETHGTKRKLSKNDLELTAKTARIESVPQAGLMAEPIEEEDINGNNDLKLTAKTTRTESVPQAGLMAESVEQEDINSKDMKVLEPDDTDIDMDLRVDVAKAVPSVVHVKPVSVMSMWSEPEKEGHQNNLMTQNKTHCKQAFLSQSLIVLDRQENQAVTSTTEVVNSEECQQRNEIIPKKKKKRGTHGKRKRRTGIPLNGGTRIGPYRMPKYKRPSCITKKECEESSTSHEPTGILENNKKIIESVSEFSTTVSSTRTKFCQKNIGPSENKVSVSGIEDISPQISPITTESHGDSSARNDPLLQSLLDWAKNYKFPKVILNSNCDSLSIILNCAKQTNQSKDIGLDTGDLEPNFDADLWPEEADANINLIKPTVQVPVWSVPLHLCIKDQTDVEKRLKKKDTLCTNLVESSRQLQSKIPRNQVDDVSQTGLSSSIPSPPPPPTWPSRLELKRLMAKLSDSNSCANTLTRYCDSKSYHNQLDDSSARKNKEFTKTVYNHLEERSAPLSKKDSLSVRKCFNVGISSNDQKSLSEKQSNKSTTIHNQESSSETGSVLTESECSYNNRKVLRNNEDTSVYKLNYENQSFNRQVVSTASLMLASFSQNIPSGNADFSQQFKNYSSNQKEQRLCTKLTKGADDKGQKTKHKDNVPNEMLQSVSHEKVAKQKKKRRGVPRNGGNRLPDGTRMKQYKRPLPGSKAMAMPVRNSVKIIASDSKTSDINNGENILVSENTEGKTLKLNTIVTIDDPGEKSELTTGAKQSIQPSVKENDISCNFLKSNEIITVGDTKEIELGTDTFDLPTQLTPLLKQVENYQKQTEPIQPSLNKNDSESDTLNTSEIIIFDDTEQKQLSANTPNCLTQKISLNKQAEDSRKLKRPIQSSSVRIINSDAIITVNNAEEIKLASNTSLVTPLPIPKVKQIENSEYEINMIQSNIQEINENKKDVNISIYSPREKISADEGTSVGCTSKEIAIVDADKSNSDTSSFNSNSGTSFSLNDQEELKIETYICGSLQENSSLDENAKASTESIISDHTKTRLYNVREQDSGESLCDATEFQRDVKTLITGIEQEYKLLEFCDDSDESESIESSDNTNKDGDKLQLQNQQEEISSKKRRKRRRTGRPRNGGHKYLCLETNRLLRNPSYKRSYPKPEMQADLNIPITEPPEFRRLPRPPYVPEDLRFYNEFPNDFRFFCDRFLDDPRRYGQNFPGDRRIYYDNFPIDPEFVGDYNRFPNEPSRLCDGFYQQMGFDRFLNDPRLPLDTLPYGPRTNFNFPGDPPMYDDRFPGDRRGYN